MFKLPLIISAALLGVVSGALLYGARRWDATTGRLQQQIDASSVTDAVRTYDEREAANLPAPVQRYFGAALTPGQPLVRALRVAHAGTFNTGESSDKWAPFTSTQRVVTRRPGFVWDGRISMMPLVPVRVHDAYVNGEGILHAAVGGIFTVANMRGTPEVAEGELMRFLAEAAWYPTALLPSQGITWTPVDDRSAKATLTDRNTSVTLTFRFNDAGLIESVRAAARVRTVGTTIVPTPWEGTWRGYTQRSGMRVPSEGEVAWLLPEGPRPYWRGRVTEISYDFAE